MLVHCCFETYCVPRDLNVLTHVFPTSDSSDHSNKRGPVLRLEASRLGWDRYFGCLVGANDDERDKPAPEVVDFALSGSGIAAGPAVWFVGDNDIDILCAHDSGYPTVLLRREARASNDVGEDPLGDQSATIQTVLGLSPPPLTNPPL